MIMTTKLMLDDILGFGKHKGEMVEDLIDDNPLYLAWLFEQDDEMFDESVIKKLEDRKII